MEDGIVITVSPPKKLTKKYYQKTGKFPIIDQGQNFIVGYTNDHDSVSKESECVVFGDHTEAIKYIDFNFAQGADGIKILKTDSKLLNVKYLYYALNVFYKKTGKYTRHFSFLKKCDLLIPPLAEQERIVSIIDKFDALVNDISIGLPAELKARRQQYEYYREKLLTFKEKENAR
jgi:type I restriction enzyme S subunit